MVGSITLPLYGDFDDDGEPEVAFGSFASGNGAVAGGLDDQYSYVGLFELSPATLAWNHPLGGEKTSTLLRAGDITGREVARLVDEPMSAGSHTVNFDASGLPSGVYFYQVTASAFTATRHMVLMK